MFDRSGCDAKRIAPRSALPQSYKHSDSADLLCKSLHPHVWAGLKLISLLMQA